MIALDGAALDGFLEVAGRDAAEMVAVEVAQFHVRQADGDIGSTGFFREGAEDFVVQLGDNVLALEIHRFLAVGGGRDGGAFDASEADGENSHTLFLCLGGRLCGFSGKVLAVGDEDDGFVGPFIAFKIFQGFEKGIANIGFPGGGGIHIGAFEGLGEESIIGGERAEQEGPSPEGEQAHPVSAKLLHQVEKVHLGAAQAAGMDIAGQHGAGHVQHDHEVTSALVGRLLLDAPLGAGGGDQGQGEANHEERQLPEAADG